jgi:hypothetical protein
MDSFAFADVGARAHSGIGLPNFHDRRFSIAGRIIIVMQFDVWK